MTKLKNFNQIEQSKEIASEKAEGLKRCREGYRQYLKSLLESKKGATTAEKLAKIQPFVEKLENYTWQELKSHLSFGCPNDWFENQGWNDSRIDNPHRYGFANIEGLYNPRVDDGVYFRIDTLHWDENEQKYSKCKPILTIDDIKLTLNLKNTQDELLHNAKLYNKLLKNKLSNEELYAIYDNRQYGGKTVWSEKLKKYVAHKDDHRKKRQFNRRQCRPVEDIKD